MRSRRLARRVGAARKAVIQCNDEEENGGCTRIRTLDPLIKSQLLYQLSYTPVPAPARRLAARSAEHTRKVQGRKGDYVARRDITGAVDFPYLEGFAAGDAAVIDEVLELFEQQAQLWSPMLDSASEGWRDAVHTVKGAARGVGAHALGRACERAESEGPAGLPDVHAALDAALFDIAAYRHEQALRSLKG